MSDKDNTGTLDNVEFHYIKGNFFRVIHTDGVIANLTPKGKISLCLFSERPAIPKTVMYDISSEGELKETNRISRNGFVREIDADIMIDIDTAIEIKDLLEEVILRHKKEFSEG